jgi:hypothetical protein
MEMGEMKLKELLEVCRHDRIELHSGKDGKLIAKTRKSLEKFGEVTVISVYCQVDCGRSHQTAVPYLYVFGGSYEIDEIKEENGGKLNH